MSSTMSDRELVKALCDALGARSAKHPDVVFPAKSVLSKEQLETVLDAIERSPALRSIDLSGVLNAKTAMTITPHLHKTVALTTLIINDCGINDQIFHEIVQAYAKNGSAGERGAAGRLSSLAVAHNSLGAKAAKDLETLLAGCTTLKKLDLSNNKFDKASAESIGTFVANCQSLVWLSLAGNNKMKREGLDKMLPLIARSRSLRFLDLSTTGIDAKSAGGVATLVSQSLLGKLVLIDNDLNKKVMAELVTPLSTHEHLQALCLSKNPLKGDGAVELAKALRQNTSLTALELDECGINSKGLGELLNALTFDNKTLESLSFDLNDWGNDTVPHFEKMFKANETLRYLSLCKAPVSQVKAVVDLWQTSLHCYEINVDKFQEALWVGSHSKRLVNRGWERFPPEIYKYMDHLTHLDLSKNPIKLLPPHISRLTNLSYLNISGCQLDTLPVELSELKKLKTLNFEGNPLASPPAEVLKKGGTAVLSYLTELATGAQPVFRCKLMFVGQENVGKTSLQRVVQHQQLMHVMKTTGLSSRGQSLLTKSVGEQSTAKVTKSVGGMMKGFKKATTQAKDVANKAATQVGVAKEDQGTKDTNKAAIWNAETGEFGAPLSTDGIDINDWAISVPFNRENIKSKQKVIFSVWDAAGQEVYETTHQFFLSNRCIYVVVFDLRFPEDKSKVEFWLQSVYARAPDAPVLVVGTHRDDPMCSPGYVQKYLCDLSNKYQTRYRNVRGFLAVACKGQLEGLLDFKKHLKDIASTLPWMGEMLPRTYIELELLVKKQAQSVDLISFHEFVELAQLCAIKEPERARQAAKTLHEFGTVVYFDEKKSGLRDIVIINPQFLTTLMATLITTKPTGVKQGRLMHKDLPFVWREPQFPTNLHPAFIALLENFELSFTPIAPDESQKYSLLPCLLPEEKPNEELKKVWSTYEEGSLQFERHYDLDFLPAGLFSRLMVRLLQYCGGMMLVAWRYGAVMRKASPRSRDLIYVECDPLTRKVWVYVRGGAPQQSLRVVVETVGIMLTAWYHVEATRFMRCPVCVRNNKGKGDCGVFTLDDAEAAAAGGRVTVKCSKCATDVKLDQIAPDIAMTDFDGCVIQPSELTIEKELGRGGFGLIHSGKWKGQAVAVKTIQLADDEEDKSEMDELDLAELAKQKQEAFTEFRREVWLMSSLKHPNLVQLLGYCINPFRMVMQLIPHGDLYNYLHDDKQSLSMKLLLKIAADIAHGMTYLAEQQPPVVHRDLKSPNILLMALDPSKPVCAVVSDFGASVPLLISGLKERTGDRVVQLPTWLAPEVLNQGEYTEQSDVYAYGIILWELVTRQHPFGEERFKFNYQIEEAILSGERPPVPRAAEPSYKQLMKRCWGAEPVERPAFRECATTIQQIAARLEPTLHLEVATPEQMWTRTTLSVMRIERAPLRQSGSAKIRST